MRDRIGSVTDRGRWREGGKRESKRVRKGEGRTECYLLRYRGRDSTACGAGPTRSGDWRCTHAHIHNSATISKDAHLRPCRPHHRPSCDLLQYRITARATCSASPADTRPAPPIHVTTCYARLTRKVVCLF